MSGSQPQENQYNTIECLIRNAISRSYDSVDYVNVALTSFRGADNYSFNRALENAEEAYLQTYMAWQAEKNDKAPARELHEQTKAFRDKMLEVKKLMDELECEGDRLLQSLHSLRS